MRSITPLFIVVTLGCTLPEIPTYDDGSDVPTRPDIFAPTDVPEAPDGTEPVFGVQRVHPARGPLTGGTRVEITGTGFAAGSRAVFGASDASDVVIQNERSILATTPANQAGFASVSVVRPDGSFTRMEQAFFFEADVAVTGVDPDIGPTTGGTPITVRGVGFAPDTRIVVGGRPAFGVRVLDDRTALAITPPGLEGPRDVLAVSSIGAGRLRRAFRFVPTPEAPTCVPAVVPIDRQTRVLLVGAHLDTIDFVSVLPGDGEMEPPEDGVLPILLTPQEPGPIQMTVAGPGGHATNAACVWAVRGEPADGPLQVLGMSPPFAPASGGVERVLAVRGLGDTPPAEWTLRIGDAAAELLDGDAANGTLRIRVPAHAPGPASCTIETPSEVATLEDCLRFEADVALEALVPDRGPLAGGTRVRLTGTGLAQVQEVRIGPLPASIVAGPTDRAIEVVTAPGSPGIHDAVVVTRQGSRFTLGASYTYGATEPALTAVTPDQGAVAGGALVSLVGSGFGPGCRVDFNGIPAIIVDDSDPARLLIRTPPHPEPGRTDVTVRFPSGFLKMLPDAFTYFDPTGVFGGVWGEPIDGTVNVTVRDGSTGKPVPAAFVLLGQEDDGAYQGRTNLDGQLTLSGLDLFGPIQISTAREDYSAFTLVGVDAENVTLFIDSLVPVSGGGGGGSTSDPLPPGLVQGRVLGVDKNLLIPPEACANRPLIHGPLCRPCSRDDECDGATCREVGEGGFHCVTACQADSECPDGYACFGVPGSPSVCMPSAGRVEVRCNTTLVSTYSYPPEQGPGAIAGADGAYVVNSRLGNVGVQCLGGVRRFSDGEFEPIVLGLTRQVSVYPARITRDQDVELNIPLDRELEVTLVNAPGGPDGPNAHRLTVSMDLGSDGVLRPWPLMGGTDQDRYTITKLPRDFSGTLEGARLSFVAEANSRSTDTLPYSVSRVRDWIPGRGNAVARVRQGSGVVLSQDIRPDTVAGCAVEGGALLFGPRGRTWFADLDGQVSALPSAATRTLRACTAAGPVVFAVGDGGMIVRRVEDAWFREPAPTSRPLFAVAAGSGGEVWAGGDGVLLRRLEDGTWTGVPYGSLAPIRALLAAPGGGMLGFGDAGLVIGIQAGVATPVVPFPTDQDLLAAANVSGLAVVVGTGGAAFVGDWLGNLAPIPLPTFLDMQAITPVGDGSVVAGGSQGGLFRFAHGAWAPIVIPGFTGEISTLVPGRDGDVLAMSSDALAIGPFLRIATFSRPQAGLPWTDRTLAWTFDGPPDPSLTYMRLYGMKSSGNWTVVAPGATRDLRLPDLRVGGGPELRVLAPGTVRVRIYHILRDAFDINRFDETALGSSAWKSWVVQQVDALWM